MNILLNNITKIVLVWSEIMNILLNNITKIVLLVIVTVFISTEAFARDYATFESFYKLSTIFGWTMAVASAIGVALVVYFTGGMGSPLVAPFVAKIGMFIGSSVWGLSGIAATNAGLAILGGGAITAGGLGMVAGAALLSGAFTFSTEIIGEYGINQIMANYSYSQLCEESKNRPNFPHFVNVDGPPEVKNVVALFEKEYKNDELPSSQHNYSVLAKAYSILNNFKPQNDSLTDMLPRSSKEHRIASEWVRINTAKSLIAFMQNNYKVSMEDAKSTMAHEEIIHSKGSVPRFIYAASSLIVKNISVEESLENFKISIQNEPKNKMIPLLFSVYTSRLGEVGYLNASSLYTLQSIRECIEDKEIKESIDLQLMITYLSRLKIDQMDIAIIYNNKNLPIVKKLNVNEKVEASLSDYKRLLVDFESFLDSIKRSNEENKTAWQNAKFTLSQYSNDLERIENMAKELAEKTIFEKIFNLF